MSMDSTAFRLHELLISMRGNDVAMMGPEEAKEFFEEAETAFNHATALLHKVFLRYHTEDRKWLWQCEPAERYASDWVSTYSVVKVDQMNVPIADRGRVQMAAAMFPGMKLTVDLLAEYHHPGGGGLQTIPKIKIRVAVSGDPELMLAETYLQCVKEDFPMNLQGVLVTVTPSENCCDDITNPKDIEEAFRRVAEAARDAGEEAYGTAGITESVYVEMDVDQSASVDDMYTALSSMGQFFTATSNALKYA